MSIVRTLRQLDFGNVVDDADKKLVELVQAVQATGKNGKLTITVNVRKATAGALAIVGKCAITKPAEPPAEVLMFAGEDGELLTEDPRQQKLELKTATVSELPLKATGTGS